MYAYDPNTKMIYILHKSGKDAQLCALCSKAVECEGVWQLADTTFNRRRNSEYSIPAGWMCEGSPASMRLTRFSDGLELQDVIAMISL